MKIFKGDLFLQLDKDSIIQVYGFYKNEKYEEERGYIIGDHVYVYYGKESPTEPGIYKTKGGIKIVEYRTQEELKAFHVDNLIELDTDNIFRDMEGKEDEFLTTEEVEVITANTETFNVTVKETDDFLTKSIKKAINAKQINLKIYKDRFANTHSFSNMKSQLSKDYNMSVRYFTDWCEILGLNWEIKLRDSGTDSLSPLTKTIKVDSNE